MEERCGEGAVLKRCHGEITVVKIERGRGIRRERVREKDEGEGRV